MQGSETKFNISPAEKKERVRFWGRKKIYEEGIKKDQFGQIQYNIIREALTGLEELNLVV